MVRSAPYDRIVHHHVGQYHHSCNTDDSGENLNVKISTGGYSLGVQGDLHTQNDNMLTC